MKNTWRKTRDKSDPYYTSEAPGGWTHKVLKLYGDPRRPQARAFCLVLSPYTPRGELGDVYTREIPGLTAAWVKAHTSLQAG